MSFEGVQTLRFEVCGRKSILVCPNDPIEGNPWIWKVEFFTAFNYAERALLEKGFYLAYHEVSDRYGSPESVEMMFEFYQAVIRDYALSPTPVLFGFSRGGLYACNFALRYPNCVSALYLDAPVLDIRSWPAGRGEGLGDPACWEECKAVYGLTERTADVFCDNPLDHAEELAAQQLPILLVCGAKDRTVPYAENGLPFFERVHAAGGRIGQIVKPECDHHPHSLSDPGPICRFVFDALDLPYPEQ